MTYSYKKALNGGEEFAEVARTYPIHKLEPISVEDCWSLLSKHAFGGEEFGALNAPTSKQLV